LHTNFAAVLTWTIGGICQSMLQNPMSNAQADVDRRARVAQRNRDDNDAIRDACAQFIHCRFDNYAAYGIQFVPSDVSTRDYFHPSVAGQAKAAAVAWSSSFDYSDQVAPVSSATFDPATGTVTLSATDDAGVSGIEYRLNTDALGYRRYTGPVTLAPGTTMTFRAVDVNGNVEGSHSLTG
jgi:hypothetical protein